MRKAQPGKTTRICDGGYWRAVRKTGEIEHDLAQRFRRGEEVQLTLERYSEWWLRVFNQDDVMITFKADSPAQLLRALAGLLP